MIKTIDFSANKEAMVEATYSIWEHSDFFENMANSICLGHPAKVAAAQETQTVQQANCVVAHGMSMAQYSEFLAKWNICTMTMSAATDGYALFVYADFEEGTVKIMAVNEEESPATLTASELRGCELYNQLDNVRLDLPNVRMEDMSAAKLLPDEFCSADILNAAKHMSFFADVKRNWLPTVCATPHKEEGGKDDSLRICAEDRSVVLLYDEPTRLVSARGFRLDRFLEFMTKLAAAKRA